MKGRLMRACGITLCIFLLLAGFAAAETAQIRYVVVFEGNHVPENAADMIASAGGRFVKALRGVGVAIAISDNPGFPDVLVTMPGILSVSREGSRTIEKAKTTRSHLSSPLPSDSLLEAQWNIRRVKADRAWHITSGSHNTIVAVIDSGIAWNHPDLKSNVIFAACFKSNQELGTVTCNCTYQGPGTFKCPSECPCSPYPDLEPHGTNVAGVIAAAFGGGHIVGVAPHLALASYNTAEVTAVVDGIPVIEAPDSSVWEAMLDAAERGFQVINLSLGDTINKRADAGTFDAWNIVVQAVLAQGSTIVASAGNEGVNLDRNIVHIPAQLPGVVSVAGTGIRPLPFYPQNGAFDVLSTINVVKCNAKDPAVCTVPELFTNFGESIDLVAPGGDCGPDSFFDFANFVQVCDERYLILTTDAFPLDPQCAAKANCETGYFSQIGTSFAAPHVSAAAALILDRHPHLSPQQVSEIINSTAENIGARVLFGNGMLDVFSAVNR